MSFESDLEKGLVAENIIEEIINSSDGFYGIKYISYDENGKVVWQNVETRYGKLRHPDFKVHDLFSDEFILLIEVKSLSSEYKNVLGLIKGLPKNKDVLYVTAEKVKIDDYILVQSHYETECRVVFVIGKDNEEKRFYWNTIDNLKKNIVAEDKPYGKNQPLCYIWNIKDLNHGLVGLI